jgi:hypothetical protein
MRLVLRPDVARVVRAISEASSEEVTNLSGGLATDRAGLADWRYPTSEPEGSPARSAVDVRGCATRRLRRSRACVLDTGGLLNPLSRLSDGWSLDETVALANDAVRGDRAHLSGMSDGFNKCT